MNNNNHTVHLPGLYNICNGYGNAPSMHSIGGGMTTMHDRYVNLARLRFLTIPYLTKIGKELSDGLNSVHGEVNNNTQKSFKSSYIKKVHKLKMQNIISLQLKELQKIEEISRKEIEEQEENTYNTLQARIRLSANARTRRS